MKPVLRNICVLLFVFALISGQGSGAFAQASDPIAQCSGEQVSGMVVAVDEATGTLTVKTATGLCTVTLAGSYNHPIVALLGRYFGDINPADFTPNLEKTHGCALYQEEFSRWSWVDCSTPGAVPIQVLALNADGSFAAQLEADGTAIAVIIEDPAVAQTIAQALVALNVTWDLTAGDVVQISDQIASYHADGMGFGVLVKLYSMAAESQAACAAQTDSTAAECGVSVEDLVAEFRAGSGMGQLFKKYAKPAHLGVGHIRKAFKQSTEAAQEPPADSTIGTDDDAGTDAALGNGNPTSHKLDNKPVKDKVKKELPASACKPKKNPKAGNPRCP